MAVSVPLVGHFLRRGGVARAIASAFAVCVAVLAGSGAAAQSAKDAVSLRFSGQANVDAAYAIVDPFDADAGVPGSSLYLGATSARLDAVGGYRDSAKAEASLLASIAYPSANPQAAFEVKKLYLSVFTPFADISAGRMIVNYGRGTVFSPVDLFTSVDFSDLSWGRLGTDAARVQVPIGDLAGLDLVSTLAEAPENATAGGRLYGNLGGWDLALSAFRDRSAFFSLDLKGDAVVGVSAEATARVQEAGTRFALMSGVDYSIGGEWFFDLEYLTNIDVGSPERQELFGADHNAFASISWTPDKLTALDLRAVGSVDGSVFAWFATATVSRSVSRGATLAAYARYRSGDVEASGIPASAVPSLAVGARLSVAF